jgi:hypothetical protein
MRRRPQDSPKKPADCPIDEGSQEGDTGADISNYPRVSIVELVDADTLGVPLGVTGRTILNWAEAKKIPTALRLGRVVRFDPAAVAQALGVRTQKTPEG